jgi:hypothetical protein
MILGDGYWAFDETFGSSYKLNELLQPFMSKLLFHIILALPQIQSDSKQANHRKSLAIGYTDYSIGDFSENLPIFGSRIHFL